jgi:alpha-2-macroglobulin
VKRLRLGPAGFSEILHDTKVSSPAGTYTFSLSIVRNQYASDLIGSATVQVREFLPDRLRMRVGFSTESFDGWVLPTDLRAQVDLQNLFGTPAEKRRVAAQLTLTPSFPSFRGYPDYRFYDPQVARESFTERLADAETDAQGKATLNLNLQRFARATYRLSIAAEGFEADGGRGVSADATQLVSNMPYLVGFKPDGALDYLTRGSEHAVDLLAIDPRAQRASVDKLSLARIEVRFVSVLMRQSNGTYKYESRRKESELANQPFAIAAAGQKLPLDTGAPGNYAYVVRDADGQQLARIDYQVAGDANVTRKMDKNAELELTLAKRDVAPGDEIELSIRAPYSGAGLITIEREKVYAWHWFKTSTTGSVQRIRVPEQLEGNAYVTVTFVRDPGSDEIYSSPLSYGVQPFSIDLESRRNTLQVETPSRVKPGEQVTLRYQTDRPARIVLFAVDEGILQVARYQAPDPLGYFFQKRALNVSTTQILDLLLPEFRRLGLSAAPGGDGEALLSQHLNPFRRKGEQPMAYWSGLLDADKTAREAKFTIPDYFNGSVRVLAVAVSDERIGVHDSKLIVRGDFVLSPNAPTTVSPGDEFDVSVGVSNNVAESGNDAAIDVALATDAGLEVVGAARQQTRIGEGHESSVRFRLRARDLLGAQGMTFSAKTTAGKSGSASRRVDLSLRPATPYMTQLTAGVVGNSATDVPVPRQLYPQYRKLEAGVSILPLGLAHGFVSYLGHYPYACTEQIVSQALPAIVLGKRPEFGYVRAQAGADLVGLLSELRARQNDQGAYKLWPGGGRIVEFVSLYAQLALIEAAERGESVPGDILLRGNGYLKTIAARDGDNLPQERDSAMAIYMLARQAQNPAAEIAALRRRLDGRYAKEWPQDLTALWLAATYDLLKKDAEATRLLRGVRFSEAKPTVMARDTYFSPMTHDALLLWITAKHFAERLPDMPPEVLTTLAKRVSDGWYESLSAGTTLLALDAYATAGASATPRLSIAEILRADKQVRPLSLPESLFPKTNFTADAGALRFGNGSDLNAFYLVEQSGFDRKPPITAIRQGMEIIREYTDNEGKPLGKVTMGQEIAVHLKYRGLDGRRMGNVALVDLLPGGFELVVPAQPPETIRASASPDERHDEDDDADGYYHWQCQICVGGNHPSLEYADIREDRVVFYAGIEQEIQEIVYRIKATNAGTFVTPPAHGEAMYDRTTVARSVAGKIEVVRP